MIDIIHSSSIEDGSSPPGAPENNDISNIKVRDDDEENKRSREAYQHHNTTTPTRNAIISTSCNASSRIDVCAIILYWSISHTTFVLLLSFPFRSSSRTCLKIWPPVTLRMSFRGSPMERPFVSISQKFLPEQSWGVISTRHNTNPSSGSSISTAFAESKRERTWVATTTVFLAETK